MPMSLNATSLWVVATPLGNPGDFSPRAREVLGSVDMVLAEDTRRAGLLLSRSGVQAQRFVSLHEHNEEQKIPHILEELRSGMIAALISDAGTPLLSDPGYRLVRACRQEGLRVSPVPGPSAPLAALSACGLPPQPYVFLGFPPRKVSEQKEFFGTYASVKATLVFFERKDRLDKTLAVARTVLGPREGCIARELTKTHEEFIVFRLGDGTSCADLLGEITVVLGPPVEETRTTVEEVCKLLHEQAMSGARAKDRARFVAGLVRGWSAKELYGLLREQKDHRS